MGGEMSFAIGEVSPFLRAMFMFYIAFCMFTLTSTIMSLFVEAMMQRAEQDEILIIQAELDRKNDYIKKLSRLFHDADKNHTGKISLRDLLDRLEAANMQAFAHTLGIDAATAVAYFKFLLGDDQSELDLESFVVGCIKLRGSAKSIDVFGLRDELKQCRNKLDDLSVDIDSL